MNHALLLKGLRLVPIVISHAEYDYESCPAIEGIKTVFPFVLFTKKYYESCPAIEGIKTNTSLSKGIVVEL